MKRLSKYVVLLRGGIGNQLFQYAYAEYLSTIESKRVSTYFYSIGDRYNRKNIIQTAHTSVATLSQSMLDQLIARIIERPENTFTKLIRTSAKLVGINVYNKRQKDEAHQYFKGLDGQGVTILRGCWQSAEMVNFVKHQLLDILMHNVIQSDEYIQIASIMEKHSSPVAIHIRDFSTSINHNQQTLSKSYYQKAIKKVMSINKNAFFFVFSNDNTKAADMIQSIIPSSNYLLVPNDENVYRDYEALILMSKCKHFIISNSTFSWWGAWLNWAQQQEMKSIYCMPNRWDMSDNAEQVANSFKFSSQCILITD